MSFAGLEITQHSYLKLKFSSFKHKFSNRSTRYQRMLWLYSVRTTRYHALPPFQKKDKSILLFHKNVVTHGNASFLVEKYSVMYGNAW